jgi:hypothetical protein
MRLVVVYLGRLGGRGAGGAVRGGGCREGAEAVVAVALLAVVGVADAVPVAAKLFSAGEAERVEGRRAAAAAGRGEGAPPPPPTANAEALNLLFCAGLLCCWVGREWWAAFETPLRLTAIWGPMGKEGSMGGSRGRGGAGGARVPAVGGLLLLLLLLVVLVVVVGLGLAFRPLAAALAAAATAAAFVGLVPPLEPERERLYFTAMITLSPKAEVVVLPWGGGGCVNGGGEEAVKAV